MFGEARRAVMTAEPWLPVAPVTRIVRVTAEVEDMVAVVIGWFVLLEQGETE